MGSQPLERFRIAQDRPGSGFDSALVELQSGGKQGHWIWYVFPQLAGLGTSSFSREYGIDGYAEAAQYLRDPVLRSRLLAVTLAVAGCLEKRASVDDLMGSRIDALKLVSSLTLFERVARTLEAAKGVDEYKALADAAGQVLAAAASQGYARCRYTLDCLGS
jgi:uncharacterized protein (DUF1810 family)